MSADNNPLISEGDFQQENLLAARTLLRQKIETEVGDQASILGTTADVTQLNAAAILALIIAIKSNTSYAGFRSQFTQTIEALVPADGGDDVYTQAANFLSAIQGGDVILTAALKGFPQVLKEMGARSTGAAKVLRAAQQSESG